MKRIDQVKKKKMKNVKCIEILNKNEVKIVFNNNQEITLKSLPEDYGYDSNIYIEKLETSYEQD